MSVKEIDATFERDLSSFSTANANRTVFHLGNPSSNVRSAGVPNYAMKLYGNKVMKKLKKHGFRIEEIPYIIKDERWKFSCNDKRWRGHRHQL